MIAAWNEVVGPTDVVYHLGDVGFAPKEKIEEILERLNGVKHLVGGNHDDKRTRRAVGWNSVQDFLRLDVNGYQVFCEHYPHWNKYQDWDIFLHGHCHATLPPTKRVLDVGVDMAYKLFGKYRPFSIEDIADELQRIEQSS